MRGIMLTLITLLGFMPVVVSAADQQPLILSARLEQPDYVAGRPVQIILTIHNSGTSTAEIGGSAWDPSSFLFDIRDAAGKPVPQTAYGKHILTPPTWAIRQIQSHVTVCRNRLLFLAPGHDRLYCYDLSRLFDMSRAGEYTVGIRRTVWLSQPSSDNTAREYAVSLTAGPLVIQVLEDASSSSGYTRLTPLPTHRRFLYIANRGAREDEKHDPISCNEVLPDGRITATVTPLSRSGAGSTGITAAPNGRFLYVVNQTDATVSQFEIRSDGRLLPLTPATVPTAPHSCSLVIDPGGKFMYAMGYAGTALFTIGKDGTLTKSLLDTSDDWRKDPLHHIAPFLLACINPSTHVLYTYTYLAKIKAYKLDKDGAATPIGEGVPVTATSDTKSIAFDAQGHYAFSVTSDKITPTRLETDGGLTLLPSVRLPSSPASNAHRYDCIAVDPTGCVLLVFDNLLGDIARYHIALDGSLSLMGVTHDSGRPVASLFDDTGRFIYTLNGQYSSLTTYQMDDKASLTRVSVDTPYRGEYGCVITKVDTPFSPDWGFSTDGLVLSTRLEQQIFSLGSEVVLTAVLKNITTHPIILGTTRDDMARFRLRSLPAATWIEPPGYQHSQLPLDLLAAGRYLQEPQNASSTSLVLPPGGQRQYRFVLSRLTDLTMAADYGLKVTRTLPDGKIVESLVTHFRLQHPYDGLTGQNQDAMPPITIDADGQGVDVSKEPGASSMDKGVKAPSTVS